MRTSSPSARDAGLSLVEVAASIALLTLLFVGLFSGLSRAMASHQEANEQVEKRVRMTRICEELRGVAFDDLTAFDGQVIEQDGFNIRLTVALISEHLVQADIAIASIERPEVTGDATILIANSD